MADEFAKGLGIFTGAGLLWMVLAGWYNTPSFDGPQLVGETTPATLGALDQLAIVLRDVSLWFAIIGALTFWVLIPLYHETRAHLDEQAE